MKLAEGIRKHGFRKWYERELTRSHVHMALTFICMIGVLAAFEAASKYRGWVDQVIDVVAIFVCGGGGRRSPPEWLHMAASGLAERWLKSWESGFVWTTVPKKRTCIFSTAWRSSDLYSAPSPRVCWSGCNATDLSASIFWRATAICS